MIRMAMAVQCAASSIEDKKPDKVDIPNGDGVTGAGSGAAGG